MLYLACEKDTSTETALELKISFSPKTKKNKRTHIRLTFVLEKKRDWVGLR